MQQHSVNTAGVDALQPVFAGLLAALVGYASTFALVLWGLSAGLVPLAMLRWRGTR